MYKEKLTTTAQDFYKKVIFTREDIENYISKLEDLSDSIKNEKEKRKENLKLMDIINRSILELNKLL